MNNDDNIFDQRNKEKKLIDRKKDFKVFFKQRDIFFMRMWKNIRFEQNGKWLDFARPIVIIKKFNNDIFRWVALSSKVKEWEYYYNFDMVWIIQCAIISQLRLYDKNRLIKKIWMINKKDFFELKQKIKNLL